MTPEMLIVILAAVGNIIVMVSGVMSLRERLTKVETTLELVVRQMTGHKDERC